MRAKRRVARFGDVEIDFDQMEIRRSDHIVSATILELRILNFFVENPFFVFSREDLIAAVWPKRKRSNGRTVDSFIVGLRRKLEKDPRRPVYLQTVYGRGYKFVPFPRVSGAHSRT
jgi:DNA-binding response OmpR family regulator